jgi:hypothetical protein
MTIEEIVKGGARRVSDYLTKNYMNYTPQNSNANTFKAYGGALGGLALNLWGGGPGDIVSGAAWLYAVTKAYQAKQDRTTYGLPADSTLESNLLKAGISIAAAVSMNIWGGPAGDVASIIPWAHAATKLYRAFRPGRT